MAWSKVHEPFKKPIGWWYHKILCEIGWVIKYTFLSRNSSKMYFRHLNKLIKYGYNLYGEKIK